MRVVLSSVGNPDFNQDPNSPMYGCDPDTIVDVDSFEMAQAHCVQFIDKNELGGGNWSGGDIFDKGKLVAYVSYNGRTWKIEEGGKKYTGDNEEIILDLENIVKKTILTLVESTKPDGDNCTQRHYKDQDGRELFFRDTNEPWEYKMLSGTHEDFINNYAFSLVIDKFNTQGIRQKDYEGGFDEAIKVIEIIL